MRGTQVVRQQDERVSIEVENICHSCLCSPQKYAQVDVDYAQKILDEQKEAFKKYGVNTKKILGTKTFKPIGSFVINAVESLKPTKEPEVLT